MVRISVQEAQDHLPQYLQRIAQGETILLTEREKPIAEIRAVPGSRKERRPIGLAKGEFTIPPEFYDPLPEELLEAFEGKGA